MEVDRTASNFSVFGLSGGELKFAGAAQHEQDDREVEVLLVREALEGDL